ncbi:MAG: NYN domain-containing protein [Sedimentisphaerales bacterium]|nr:NYN domain-containing protein [Sedimentisphaerales bacterium]
MTIVDGNNLLWALHERFDEREVTTEIDLCRVLSRYFALTAEEGQVVFDGSGPARKGDFDSVTNIEVVFSGFHKDSDSVIEEKIKANTAPRRLTVVSSDRRLRRAAAARKATGVRSEDFWQEVQKELRRGKPRKKEPQAKKEGLSEGETEQWMDLFGLDE